MAYDSIYTGAEIDEAIDQLQNLTNIIKQQMLESTYPIGSIYMSINSTSPATFLGGTWERIQDKFLLCSGSTYSPGTTGGSASNAHTHTLSHTHTVTAAGSVGGHSVTTAEMPSHNHRPYLLLGGYSGWGNITTGGNNSDYMYKWAGDNIYNTNSATYTDHGTNSPLTITSNTGSSSSHNHGFTGSAVTSGEASTATTSGASATNNMPPYLSIYVWKRTA